MADNAVDPAGHQAGAERPTPSGDEPPAEAVTAAGSVEAETPKPEHGLGAVLPAVTDPEHDIDWDIHRRAGDR